MDDEAALLLANTAYYEAFNNRDFNAMSRIWADEEDDVSCIHPGWPTLVGRKSVLQSWLHILRNPSQAAIECRPIKTIVSAEEGRVLCIEMVGDAALAATNWFRLIDGAWRLIHHQASPIAVPADAEPEEPAPRRRQMH
jgi:hypothetical protein